LTYERDAAVSLLSEPVASTEPAPSPAVPASSGRTLGSAKLPKPVLKPKPDISSRPLVGYSMVSESAGEERVDTGKSSPRLPRP
jgi:hypothetical protein